MHKTLQRELSAVLGSQVREWVPLAGGCINRAHKATLADGRVVFIKSHPGCDPRLFPAEARGLEWLAAAGALRIPAVIAHSSAESADAFLALEYLEPGRRRRDYDERLGRGLAALHRAGAPSFGLDHANFLGTLEQENTEASAWAPFYVERRLEPQLRRAVDSGVAPRELTSRFAALFANIENLAGPLEAPARLHGDLWSGNLHVDAAGEPTLLDPAVYGGHREIDLAMLRLFGSPSPRVFAAYEEVFPLAPKSAERVPLYQLYPLLAHLNLFGRSYLAAIDAALIELL